MPRVRRALPGPVVVLVLILAMALVASPRPALGSPLDSPLPDAPDVPGWAPDLGQDVRYELPVSGRVLRAFDPPTTAFGAGHRGVDLEVAVGGTIRVAGNGSVTFAGPVAGRRWVSVAHADGHLTSYGPLAALAVRAGDRVVRGDPLGVLDAGGHGVGGRNPGLHWGARDAIGRYVDPLGLLSDDLRRPSLVGAGQWEGTAHRVNPYPSWEGGWGHGTIVRPSPVASAPGFAVAPNPNHLILIPGLASSSHSPVLDPAHLGYHPHSVTAFSYAGRQDGVGPAADPRRDQLPYGPEHTWDGPRPAAERLAAQLRAQAAREPGRAVDLIGHSMGGLVILHYLLEHHDPYDRTLPPIGHVVTIGSPLRGSDLAVLGEVLGDDPLFGGFAGGVQDRLPGGGSRLPLDAPAIGEMASGSRATGDLALAWDAALLAGTAGPLAMGTRVLTIGGSRDLVVTPHRSRHPAGPWTSHGDAGHVERDGEMVVQHRVLPGGHDAVLHTEALREVTWRFLAGEEVVDSPGRLSTVVGGEVGDAAAMAARVLQLWALWRSPPAWGPTRAAIPRPPVRVR